MNFQLSPRRDREGSPLRDFNRPIYPMPELHIQRLAQFVTWPGMRSQHVTGTAMGTLQEQRNFRRRWERRHRRATVGSQVAVDGYDLITGNGNYPSTQNLFEVVNAAQGGGGEWTFSPSGKPQEFYLDHAAAKDCELILTEPENSSNNVHTLTGCSGQHGPYHIELTLDHEVPESTPVIRGIQQINSRAWVAFENSVRQQHFQDWPGGYAVNTPIYDVDPSLYTGAPLPELPETAAAPFRRPTIGANDVGVLPQYFPEPFPVGPQYPWARVVDGNAIHNAIWSYWLYPVLAEEWNKNPSGEAGYQPMHLQRCRFKWSSNYASTYFMASANIIPVLEQTEFYSRIKYEVSNIRVFRTGTVSHLAPIDLPMPDAENCGSDPWLFVEDGATLSVGRLIFAIVGESPADWSARTGYTL